ncbi:MAG TPA: hypothetical protein VK217_04100 [Acidimicrobiales bacterium]|nr:hypothetical protein [Acidimicrobiales bacterium]
MPAWLVSTLHVPTVWKLTTPPEIERTELDEASMVKATARPELAAAVGV